VANLESPSSSRWDLYRVLSEPVRLRMLALAADEELSIGELAELLDESQPNVSRHVAALRQAGLLRDRREGTRTLVHVPAEAVRDAVVADGLGSGRALCEREGRLARVADVLRAREAAAREFFARAGKAKDGTPADRGVVKPGDAMPSEIGAYLAALALLLPQRALAVDAGTGDGRLLDMLAPVYERVIAIDRSAAQLAAARERIALRGYANVALVQADLDSDELRKLAAGKADAVFAVRLLHHAPQPAKFVAQLASLCGPGGALVVVDYAHHEDESMRDQADVWLGFEPSALRRFARAAGLEDLRVARIPDALRGDGPDRHLPWQVMVGKKIEGKKR
jgi:DNA-binding transcriptional ArsR family regulator